ncbi:MAG TPA: iron-sulfur cluster assembly accessory protein [Nitrososphaerales archaeon]|nr:iron-sulfur cluster assembly accessory protein [Nitrososphaerales archaeon]
MQEMQPLIVLTPVAKEKLQQVMEAEKSNGSFLRIDVMEGGGCACSGGYRYALSLEDKPGTSDLVEDVDGLKVMVNKGAAEIVRGSKIDYYETLQRTGFKIENPNVHAEACGCGGH